MAGRAPQLLERGDLRPAAGLAACPAHPGAPPVPRPPGEPEAAARRCQRWTLVVVCLASALLLFNVTAPNVALPAIAADLAAGFETQQWVLSVYALVLASLLLAGGALGDRYGHRRCALLGLALFGAGSVLCGLSPSAPVLVAGRVVQGLGAAVLFPNGLALLAAEFEGPARARAVGIWGASVSGAIALGPLLGGVLVETSGWRSQFLVAAALVLPTLAVGARHLRGGPARAGARLDWLGTTLLTGALVLLVVVLQRAGALGWTSAATLTMATGALALFAGFLLAEHRVRAPLIEPALLRDRTFLGATLVALVFAAAGFAPVVYLTLFLLQVGGSGPTLAGLQVAPFAVSSLAVSLLAARVVARAGVRLTLVAGLVLCGLGPALLVGLSPDAGLLRLLPGLLVFGAGAGLVNPTMTVAALGTVDAAHSGMASGVNNTARQLGIAAGIAGLGTLLQAVLADRLTAALAGAGLDAATAADAARLAAAGGPGAAARELGSSAGVLSAAYDRAFVAALDAVLLVAIGIVALGIVATLALVRPTPRDAPARRPAA
ncbi:MFS transporter [Geodermatophilus sp. SYSU D00696]